MNSLKLIICLFIALSLLPLTTSALSIIKDYNYDYSLISSEICLMQLREVMLIAYDIEVSSSRVAFRYKGGDCSLSLINGKLVMQPGTVIYLDKLESLSFYQEGGAILIKYRRGNHDYETVISPTRGLHLADFYRDPDDGTDTNDNADQLPE